MLLNRAEVDAGVIPSARARVLALSSYIINDHSFLVWLGIYSLG